MGDKYKNFQDLEKSEDSKNFEIKYENRNSDFAIIAPHGGKIEPFTTEIAERIANERHSFYSFIGKKAKNNRDLHITSSNIDEKNCLDIAGSVQEVIAIHGCIGSDSFVHLGGLDEELVKKIEVELKKIDIEVRVSPYQLSGKNQQNICNKGKSKKGIQIEISRKLRGKLSESNQLFNDFTDAIRNSLENNE